MPSALISVSGDGIERCISAAQLYFVILKSLVGKCFILIFFWAVSQNLYLFKPYFFVSFISFVIRTLGLEMK